MASASADKEKKGLYLFREWLNKNRIPYAPISRDTRLFSDALKEIFEAKTPDFLILIEKLGLIFVDVKYKEFHTSKRVFLLDPEEVKEYLNLEKKFNFKVWFIFSNDEMSHGEWHWLSVEDAAGMRDTIKPAFGGRKGEYRGNLMHITPSRCIAVYTDDSTQELLSKIIPRHKT